MKKLVIPFLKSFFCLLLSLALPVSNSFGNGDLYYLNVSPETKQILQESRQKLDDAKKQPGGESEKSTHNPFRAADIKAYRDHIQKQKNSDQLPNAMQKISLPSQEAYWAKRDQTNHERNDLIKAAKNELPAGTMITGVDVEKGEVSFRKVGVNFDQLSDSAQALIPDSKVPTISMDEKINYVESGIIKIGNDGKTNYVTTSVTERTKREGVVALKGEKGTTTPIERNETTAHFKAKPVIPAAAPQAVANQQVPLPPQAPSQTTNLAVSPASESTASNAPANSPKTESASAKVPTTPDNRATISQAQPAVGAAITAIGAAVTVQPTGSRSSVASSANSGAPAPQTATSGNSPVFSSNFKSGDVKRIALPWLDGPVGSEIQHFEKNPDQLKPNERLVSYIDSNAQVGFLVGDNNDNVRVFSNGNGAFVVEGLKEKIATSIIRTGTYGGRELANSIRSEYTNALNTNQTTDRMVSFVIIPQADGKKAVVKSFSPIQQFSTPAELTKRFSDPNAWDLANR